MSRPVAPPGRRGAMAATVRAYEREPERLTFCASCQRMHGRSAACPTPCSCGVFYAVRDGLCETCLDVKAEDVREDRDDFAEGYALDARTEAGQ